MELKTSMQTLALVFKVKIAFTILFWIIPTMLFPVSWLQKLGLPSPASDVFLRLLGAAFTALVVGYICGLKEIEKGIYPENAVWVGIVSNGLAFSVLLIASVRSEWAGWGKAASAMMWSSMVATGLITTGLTAFGACR